MIKKIALIYGLLVIVLVALAGGAAWYFKNTTPVVVDNTVPPAKTDCDDEVDGLKWEIYKNSKYNFQFQYPHNLKNVSVYDGSIVVTAGRETGLLLIDPKNNMKYSVDVNIEEGVEMSNINCNGKYLYCESFILNDYKFIVLNSTYGSGVDKTYFTKINGGVIGFNFGGYCKEVLVDKMIESFKTL